MHMQGIWQNMQQKVNLDLKACSLYSNHVSIAQAAAADSSSSLHVLLVKDFSA